MPNLDLGLDFERYLDLNTSPQHLPLGQDWALMAQWIQKLPLCLNHGLEGSPQGVRSRSSFSMPIQSLSCLVTLIMRVSILMRYFVICTLVSEVR